MRRNFTAISTIIISILFLIIYWTMPLQIKQTVNSNLIHGNREVIQSLQPELYYNLPNPSINDAPTIINVNAQSIQPKMFNLFHNTEQRDSIYQHYSLSKRPPIANQFPTNHPQVWYKINRDFNGNATELDYTVFNTDYREFSTYHYPLTNNYNTQFIACVEDQDYYYLLLTYQNFPTENEMGSQSIERLKIDKTSGDVVDSKNMAIDSKYYLNINYHSYNTHPHSKTTLICLDEVQTEPQNDLEYQPISHYQWLNIKDLTMEEVKHPEIVEDMYYNHNLIYNSTFYFVELNQDQTEATIKALDIASNKTKKIRTIPQMMDIALTSELLITAEKLSNQKIQLQAFNLLDNQLIYQENFETNKDYQWSGVSLQSENY
ncbi:hypothetical protein CYJ57_06995 [Falseniella ignava]|uniref:Uncharacterized protein n=1 Tax=Falseniella ignava TaxID=137730 RepID=A0A2I1JW30_9LACT|nr:hypothetical protein [Falseniella ignava]PKY87585.1 hypothetical protein CYJ57_06995 [Falseniella ignava]